MSVPELQTADINGLQIGWRESGSGPALVLLHGIGSGSLGWKHQYSAFADRYRVIGWDAPGYGGSGDLEGAQPPTKDYADAMAGLLDHLGISAAHFCGNSLGCLMISSIAKHHPTRVRSMVLSDAASGHGRKSEEERAATVAARLDPLGELGAEGFARQRGRRLIGSRATDEAFEEVVAVMSQIRIDSYGQAAWMLANGDIFANFEGCTQPALVICGDEDVVTTPESNRAIAEFIGAPYREIKGAGHLPYVETPAEFNALLGEFLAGQTQAAAE